MKKLEIKGVGVETYLKSDWVLHNAIGGMMPVDSSHLDYYYPRDNIAKLMRLFTFNEDVVDS